MSRKPIFAVVLSLSGLLIALALPQSCLACSCLQPPTPVGGWTRETLVTQSDVIFRGKVVHAGPLRVLGGGATDGTYEVTFEAAEVWKGDVKGLVVVRAGQGGGDCTIPFQVGQEWLVYGHGDPAGVVTTGTCSRTSQLPGGQYADDLALLGSGTPVSVVDPQASTMIANTSENVGAAAAQPTRTDALAPQAPGQHHAERSITYWTAVVAGVLALAVITITARNEWAKRRR
jgi:hypothetical protein